MRTLALALCLVALPAVAQDAGRGKLVYETHCGGCHYERVHQRDRAKSSIQSRSDLRDEVALRAGQTKRPFTLEDLEDIAEYLDHSHYKLAR